MDIKNLFNSLANRYDLTNSVISLGLEKFWRRKFLNSLGAASGKVLDVCSGSGISTYEIYKEISPSEIVGIDFSKKMVERSRSKYRKHNKINFIEADAVDLPFEDSSFDLVTVVFGIRNVIDREKAMKEFYRVSKSSAKLIIMEFGNEIVKPYKCIADFYLCRILPFLGGILTGNRDAYRYLVKTIKEFPHVDDFIEFTEKTGWEVKNIEKLNKGICNIFNLKKSKK